MAREFATSLAGIPSSASDHRPPPSVDFHSPVEKLNRLVPMYSVSGAEGSSAIDSTLSGRGSLPFAGAHVSPPSIDLYRPSPPVPSYTIEGFVGSMASASPLPPVDGPLVVHVPIPADAGTPPETLRSRIAPIRSGWRHRLPRMTTPML